MINSELDNDVASLARFGYKELLEMRLSFRSRWHKLKAIQDIYGDASEEYARAEKSIGTLKEAVSLFDKFLEQTDELRAERVEADPDILYMAPEGVVRKVDREQRPVYFKPKPIVLGEAP